MMILGILLSFAGLGVFCWALFNLAVFALPFFAGLSAGLATLHSGAGPLGAIAVGFAAGVLTMVAGQIAFGLVRSPPVRVAVALLFAAPAAIAGYYMALHLSSFVSSAVLWRRAFAVLGAGMIGITALGRLVTGVGLPPAQDRSAAIGAR